MLALDQVFYDLLLVQRVRMAKDLKGGGPPVETVDAKVLCQPVLEVILFLQEGWSEYVLVTRHWSSRTLVGSSDVLG